jgi:hypothetical protein
MTVPSPKSILNPPMWTKASLMDVPQKVTVRVATVAGKTDPGRARTCTYPRCGLLATLTLARQRPSVLQSVEMPVHEHD